MDTPRKVASLIEKFNEVENVAHTPSAIKTKFIAPLFRLLGWSLSSKKKSDTPYPEVIEIKNDPSVSKDYLFLKNENYQFYLSIVENVGIEKNEISTYKKLQHYCWNANISIGIITDFRTISIFDCLPENCDRINPVKRFKYSELTHEWEDLYNIFSKDAVYKNSLNKFKKIDQDSESIHFVLANNLISWHNTLYKDIHSKNPNLLPDDIKITANRFINRLLFLRICEERGLEPQNTLFDLSLESEIYNKLLMLFQKADEKYNSGIFHFQKESNRPDFSIDSISFTILIEDQVIKDIIKKLYSEHSGYDFSNIPTNIICQSYNIYLQQIEAINFNTENVEKIELDTNSHTHPAIIEYIVDKTIGSCIKDRSPGKRSINSINVLDLCCGSGLFLLESYQFFYNLYLKDYYKTYFNNKDELPNLPIFEDENGVWQLSWNERIRILLNQVYGVDISKFAIETTSFILLLKLIEGINKENWDSQLVLFRENALPDLSNNIKCGNALIESDIFRLHQFDSGDDKIKSEIKAFDWQKEFNSITSAGGFDIILGKPPENYLKSFSQKTKPYFKQHYNYFHDSEKTFLLFYEKAFKLLKSKGYLGYVVPENWLASPVTKNLIQEFWIKEAININIRDISPNYFNALITIIKKQTKGETALLNVGNFEFEKTISIHVFKDLNFINLNFFFGNFSQFSDSELIKKIESNSKPLVTFARPFSGYNPYEIGKGNAPEGGPQTAETLQTKPYHSTEKLNENWKTEIVGRNISRYCLKFNQMRWVKYGPWLAAPRSSEIFNNERILVHERISAQNGRIESSICTAEVYHGRDIITIIPIVEYPAILYLLGIINSKLINWYFLVINSNNHGIFPKLKVSNISEIPIRTPDQDLSQIKYLYQELIALVKRNLELNQKKLEVQSARDTTTMDQLIQNIDTQIDEVVYSLYNLSKEEIKIIKDCFG